MTTPSAAGQVRSGLGIAARWVGIPLLVLTVLAAVVIGVATIWVLRDVDDLVDDLADSPPVTYPARSIACSAGQVDAPCVARAAETAGRPVAWLPGAGEVETRVLLVAPRAPEDPPVDRGQVRYEVAVDGVELVLSSAPAHFSPGDLREGPPLRAGGRTARTWRAEDGSTMRLDWAEGGQDYRLEAYRRSGEGPADVSAVAEDALAAVRYATPPPA